VKLLLLGGTSDARRLAKPLIDQGIEVVYSVAGLVRMPDLDCQVISGGFSDKGGLQHYLMAQQIAAVLDATHPYAVNISASAVAACQALGLNYWRFDRPPWSAQADDHWININDWQQLLAACKGFKKPFLTLGQVAQQPLDSIAQHSEQVLYRTAVSGASTLADNVLWHKAIGPFDEQSEIALFKQHDIDVLVSKNAGGQATQAKLGAARALKIPVIMFARPSVNGVISASASASASDSNTSGTAFNHLLFNDIEQTMTAIAEFYQSVKRSH
jgi:precorrin-6A/cobalt-precorrin-6A reductase